LNTVLIYEAVDMLHNPIGWSVLCKSVQPEIEETERQTEEDTEAAVEEPESENVCC